MIVRYGKNKLTYEKAKHDGKCINRPVVSKEEKNKIMDDIITKRSVIIFLRDYGPATAKTIAEKLTQCSVCPYTLMRVDEMLRKGIQSGEIKHSNGVFSVT